VKHPLLYLEPLRTLPKLIEAPHYNRIRLAVIRGIEPLRIDLPSYQGGLGMILDAKAWVCVDYNDAPWLAYTNFEMHNAIHEPVACDLHLYHYHAGLIMGSILENLDAILQQTHK